MREMSGKSRKRGKGAHRPVVPEMERAEVLAALACVDYLFVFDDLTPQRIIDAIVPDILVKGADWELSHVVGRETVERTGGSVLTVPLVEGASTSGIIRKVLDNFNPPS